MEKKENMLKRYIINIQIGIDQLANAVLGGDPDETFRTRNAKTKWQHGGKIPFHRYPLRWLVDHFFKPIDKNRTIESIDVVYINPKSVCFCNRKNRNACCCIECMGEPGCKHRCPVVEKGEQCLWSDMKEE